MTLLPSPTAPKAFSISQSQSAQLQALWDWLVISAKKTKTMLTGDHEPPTDVFVTQNKAETEDNFTYLGRSINSQGNIDR